MPYKIFPYVFSALPSSFFNHNNYGPLSALLPYLALVRPQVKKWFANKRARSSSSGLPKPTPPLAPDSSPDPSAAAAIVAAAMAAAAVTSSAANVVHHHHHHQTGIAPAPSLALVPPPPTAATALTLSLTPCSNHSAAESEGNSCEDMSADDQSDDQHHNTELSRLQASDDMRPPCDGYSATAAASSPTQLQIRVTGMMQDSDCEGACNFRDKSNESHSLPPEDTRASLPPQTDDHASPSIAVDFSPQGNGLASTSDSFSNEEESCLTISLVTNNQNPESPEKKEAQDEEKESTTDRQRCDPDEDASSRNAVPDVPESKSLRSRGITL